MREWPKRTKSKGFKPSHLLRIAALTHMRRYPFMGETLKAYLAEYGKLPMGFERDEKVVEYGTERQSYRKQRPVNFHRTSAPIRSPLKERIAKSAFWPEMRRRVIERDGYKCAHCGGEENGNLHLHHIVKRRDGGSDEITNLIALCPKCHSMADQGKWIVGHQETVLDEIRRKMREQKGLVS